MEQLLQFFVLLPLAAFAASLILPRKKERIISSLVISAISIHLSGIISFVLYWLLNDTPVLDIKHATLFRSREMEIFIDFYFDTTTAVYAFTGSVVALAVAVFSRFYMHRESGFKRYFSTLLLFFSGYNIAVFAGNYETFFVGWEVVGITSFLLIAFYRDRYLPVKNALKVVSVYRVGDICLILALWMSHHLWHENITFQKLNDSAVVAGHFSEHGWMAVFVALMVAIAATVKSAQFPFSSWLPRAMEGPTTSSAIFYGSLSVHLGVFLLLRTFPYWENMLAVKVLIIITGVLTGIIATLIARVQSTVKTQIAYASAAQIGLMFVEVALGFHTLALVHFAGNAFLRTYQLLVSPSVLSYLVHDMFFSFKPSVSETGKLKNTIYMLSVKEWELDFILHRFLWKPFKWVGNRLEFINAKLSGAILAVIFLSGFSCYHLQASVPAQALSVLPFLFSFAAFALILKAFTERGSAIRAWLFAGASQFFIALSIGLLNEKFEPSQILIYLSGSGLAAVTGYLCLHKVKAIDGDIELNHFHGYNYENPRLGTVFLLSGLALVGLPFTPTFIGIDVLFSHIGKSDIVLIVLTALSYLFLEIAVLRIYLRIFLGQHKKLYHPVAYRSS